MVNWYGIETEVAFRRREWQREVEAAARAAQAIAGHERAPGRRLPHLSLSSLRSLIAPRLSLAAPLKADCRTAVC